MTIYGKNSADGLSLTDIQELPAPRTWPDGSTDVVLVAWPTTSGPYRYDAANQLAVQLVANSLLFLENSLKALTQAQKTAIWNDFTSGNPQKWSTDTGPNAPSIAICHLLGTSGTLNATDLSNCKMESVAFYVMDNPNYLVHPPFDPSINIPGRS